MMGRLVIVLAIGVVAASGVRAGEIPPGLPHYDLAMDLDLANHFIRVRMQATWTNRHTIAAKELVFNAHSHFVLPDKDVGLNAKTLEIFRITPSEAMGETEPALEVQKVILPDAGGK